MTRGRACLRLLVPIVAGFGYVACAAAQVVPPDAGRIQEQLRPPEPPRKPAAAPIRIQQPRPDDKGDTPPFFVAEFRVRGATVFPEAELAALLGEPRRMMTLGELRVLADRLTAFYRERGYIVARALIPPQDVRDGVVQIRIVEGRYERIDIANASEISEARLRGMIGGVKEDAVIHGPTLERAVLLLSDLAGIEPKATLEPGAQAGTTNLVLEIAPTREAEFDAMLDNAGNSSTGRTRLSAGATWNSPFDIGDRATARLIASGISGKRLVSFRAGYEAPLGTSGLRGNAYALDTRYELGESFAALEATGSARAAGAAVAYPVIRTTDRNLRLQAGGEARELVDRVGAIDTTNKRALQVLQWGGGGDMRDNLLGGARTAAQALVSNGLLDLRTQALTDADAVTTRAEGSFWKLWLGVQRAQRVAQNVNLAVNYVAQRAGANLDSSEKYSVGGPTAVRAYPPGEAAGDDVQLLQAELRYNAGAWLDGQLVPVAFLDWARSRINHQTWEGFSGKNVRELSGFGIGAEWTLTGQFFARGWYAHKLGSEPATADTDRDSRLWLQAGVLF